MKILGYRDPRCKHEYLDSIEWLKLTKVYKLIERSLDGDDDGDESDKHVEARDRRYSCLMLKERVGLTSPSPHLKTLLGTILHLKLS